jgi:hypothetical protein
MNAPLIALSFALALISSGCSSQASKKEPAPSEALIIARAAGFKEIRDITAESLKSVTDSNGSTLRTAQAAAVATGVVKPTPGIPSGLEAAFLFINSLPVARREDSPRLLAWMPRDLAPSPEAATVVLRELLLRVIATTLPEAKVELREKVFEEKPTLGPNKVRHLWDIHIEAADCADCRFSMPAIHGHGIPPTGQAPMFLGSYDAYIWTGMGFRDDSRISGYPWLAESLDPAQRLDFLRRLSTNLPAWAYIYIPYDPKVAPYPQILHQGRELIFVEPGLDEPEP